MIKVMNVKSYKGDGIYIGREYGGYKGSVLGNQFHIGMDGNREVVIKKYLDWLRRMYKGGLVHKSMGIESFQVLVYDELMRLVEMNKRGEDIVLLCWCKPESCHGDVVRGVVEKLSI
jgi:hypothetical protein